MFMTRKEHVAKAIASEKGLFYGWSVFSPGWYVGTESQLQAIGVIEPKKGVLS